MAHVVILTLKSHACKKMESANVTTQDHFVQRRPKVMIPILTIEGAKMAEKLTVRDHYLDNRWVVPYNPYLSAKYGRRVNVKICSIIKAVKYLYKYAYKGHDRIRFIISPDDKSIVVDDNFDNLRHRCGISHARSAFSN